ncbi:DUF5753 domain-containing protein [Actinacidiphila alni]|uniref:DUF5753 domain-containing protein n=1 Tax=Actinacidiphila alni TaxID=380248 RepID=UPI00345367E9
MSFLDAEFAHCLCSIAHTVTAMRLASEGAEPSQCVSQDNEAVRMTQSSSPDPGARYPYGEQLKIYRDAAGLTQDGLGLLLGFSGSMIAHIEAGRRYLHIEDAKRLDQVLQTDGFFERFHREAVPARFADHFNRAAECESRAVAIHEYAVALVPGLLQTEAYARATFLSQTPNLRSDEVDRNVVNRLGRSQILADPLQPVMWQVLSESVLRSVVGGRAAMAEQLEHIRELASSGRVLVQVVPFSAGAYATMSSMLTLFEFTDEPPAAYVEGLYTGSFIDDPARVRKYREAFGLTAAVALSPTESLKLIDSVAKEYRAP